MLFLFSSHDFVIPDAGRQAREDLRFHGEV